MNGTGPQTVMVVADEYGNTMVMDGDAIAIENTGIVMFGVGKNNKDDKDDKGDSETNDPEDYLNEALERQGLDKIPKNMKESWTSDGYKYEVRVHEAYPEYEKEGSIYRVSRQKLL